MSLLQNLSSFQSGSLHLIIYLIINDEHLSFSYIWKINVFFSVKFPLVSAAWNQSWKVSIFRKNNKDVTIKFAQTKVVNLDILKRKVSLNFFYSLTKKFGIKTSFWNKETWPKFCVENVLTDIVSLSSNSIEFHMKLVLLKCIAVDDWFELINFKTDIRIFLESKSRKHLAPSPIIFFWYLL